MLNKLEINSLLRISRGHNEIDDPTFTNPSMYRIINDRISTPDLYAEKLVAEGVVTKEQLDKEVSAYTETLQKALTDSDKIEPENVHFKGHWSSCEQARDDAITIWDTGMLADLLRDSLYSFYLIIYHHEYQFSLKLSHQFNSIRKIETHEVSLVCQQNPHK